MNPEYIIGEVGFGPNFCGEDVNLRRKITELEVEVSKLTKHCNILRSSLKECAALGGDIANRKHEALLSTAS